MYWQTIISFFWGFFLWKYFAKVKKKKYNNDLNLVYEINRRITDIQFKLLFADICWIKTSAKDLDKNIKHHIDKFIARWWKTYKKSLEDITKSNNHKDIYEAFLFDNEYGFFDKSLSDSKNFPKIKFLSLDLYDKLYSWFEKTGVEDYYGAQEIHNQRRHLLKEWIYTDYRKYNEFCSYYPVNRRDSFLDKLFESKYPFYDIKVKSHYIAGRGNLLRDFIRSDNEKIREYRKDYNEHFTIFKDFCDDFGKDFVLRQCLWISYGKQHFSKDEIKHINLWIDLDISNVVNIVKQRISQIPMTLSNEQKETYIKQLEDNLYTIFSDDKDILLTNNNESPIKARFDSSDSREINIVFNTKYINYYFNFDVYLFLKNINRKY